MPQDHGKTLLEWTFPEYEKHQRSLLWYISAYLIGGGLLAFSIWTQNFLFTVILVIVGIIFFLHEKKEPLVLECKITEDGVKVGQRFSRYKDLKKFWIIYEPPEVKKLYFESKAALRIPQVIPLQNQNPLKVREVVLKYLEEDLEKEEESLSERIGRVLKI